jgi:hypothetical protein
MKEGRLRYAFSFLDRREEVIEVGLPIGLLTEILNDTAEASCPCSVVSQSWEFSYINANYQNQLFGVLVETITYGWATTKDY